MKNGIPATSGTSTPTGSTASVSPEGSSVDGWLEVGHKQRPAVTRSSGHIALESPITKIFGGKLRSEFRVPGNKNSVTLEPYQPLQLDIGSPDVNNIIDALKGLTKPETIHGDFNSSRGPKLTATKQIFISNDSSMTT
jgi:ubiquitin carboxyl-terminal hydrolase 10